MRLVIRSLGQIFAHGWDRLQSKLGHAHVGSVRRAAFSFEPCESRKLMDATWTLSPPFTGPEDDLIYVHYDVPDQRVHFAANGGSEMGIPRTQQGDLVTSLVFDGLGGDDTLMLDFSGGSLSQPMYDPTIQFAGGTGTNTLVIEGLSADQTLSETTGQITVHDGTLDVDTIIYTNSTFQVQILPEPVMATLALPALLAFVRLDRVASPRRQVRAHRINIGHGTSMD
jgi:hypothetical protein